MPRFSILAHDYPVPHWDLFLEDGSVSRSWRLLEPLRPGAIVPAEPIGNHRLLYLDYEGPVSGGRGTVSRVDVGVFWWQVDSSEHVSIKMEGKRFVGRVTLVAIDGQWTCQLDPERPNFAPHAGAEPEEDRSSGR